MRLFKKLLAVMLVLCLSLTLFACGLNNNGNEGNNKSKPAFSVVIANYENKTAKKSVTELSLTATLFGSETHNSIETFTFGLGTAATRICNEGRVYVDGSLGAINVSNGLLELLDMLKVLIKDKANDFMPPDTIEIVRNFLEGNSRADYQLGYLDGNYNLKGQYFDSGNRMGDFWGVVTDRYINNSLKKQGLGTEIYLSDYLMTSTLFDFTTTGGWIEGESASKKANKDGLFEYSYTLGNTKVKELLFGLLSGAMTLIGGENNATLAPFVKLIPYLSNWLILRGVTAEATVNQDSLPVTMNTTATALLNIDVKELKAALKEVIGGSEAESIGMILELVNTFMLKGENGESGKIALKFDLSMKETYSYSKSAVSLSDVDADLFLPATEEAAGRDITLTDPDWKEDGDDGEKEGEEEEEGEGEE